jgi:VIT1/CCC1 family predicted Fe2+/Mn2+ transporter
LLPGKGLGREDAGRLAGQIMSDRKVALDTLAREELGLNPTELGSPLAAATSSLLTFASLAVGGGIGILNGRSPVRSGLRQLLLGGAAALVTFGIGHLIGATVS